MTTLFVDGDACPVRDEVYRVADRVGLQVFVVANGSRPLRPPGRPNVTMITVEAGADVADDWIVERITAADVCITTDIPLAARCLAKGARGLAPSGKIWTGDNIGNALAGRAVGQYPTGDRHDHRRPAATDETGPLTVPERTGCRGAGGAARVVPPADTAGFLSTLLLALEPSAVGGQ